MTILRLFAFILMAQIAFASDHIQPEKEFTCFKLSKKIGDAYKTSDRNELYLTIKIALKENFQLKGRIYSGLAKKIGKEIQDISFYKHTFQLLDLTKSLNRDSINFNFETFDANIGQFLKNIETDKLKVILALVHRAILNHEILLCGLSQAPDSLWENAEYITLQPVEELEKVRQEFFDCQELIWQHYFPESSKIEKSNPGLIWAHAFIGLDNNLSNTTASQYFGQLYRCITSCGKNYGRKKCDTPKEFLMEPRKRLFQFVLSPQFKSIFKRKDERRIIRYPTIEFVNAMMPWSFLFPSTLPASRYVTAVEDVITPLNKNASTQSSKLKDLTINLKNKEISQLSDEIKGLREKVVFLEQSLQELTKRKVESDEKCTLLKNKNEILDKDLKRYKDQDTKTFAQDLEDQIAKLKIHLKNEKNENSKLRTSIEALNSDLNAQKIFLSDCQRKLDSLSALSDQNLEQLKQKLDLEIHALKEQKKTQIDEIERLNKIISDLKKKLKNNHNNKRLANRLQKQKTEKEKLEQELQQKQQQLDEHISAANQFLANQADTKEAVATEQNSNLESINARLNEQIVFQQRNLLEAGQLIQHLSSWCSFLQQGWASTATQLEASVLPRERIITIEGEDFFLTVEQQDEILREHLRTNVLQKRDPATVNNSNN